MSRQIIQVKHNIEVAHRLSQLPGKCQNIHGHSMWVTLSIENLNTPVDSNNVFLEFGELKKSFRHYLDSVFDHHLLLFKDDPIAEYNLPGAKLFMADPTTENLSRWIYKWAQEDIGDGFRYHVLVQETPVNFASYGDF